MSVHYRDGIPSFCCRLANLQHGGSNCLSFNGRWLEPLIERLVLQALEPAAVELSLRAADDIEKDRAGLETYHKQSVERATYQADLAHRRYEEVDPRCSKKATADRQYRGSNCAACRSRRTSRLPAMMTCPKLLMKLLGSACCLLLKTWLHRQIHHHFENWRRRAVSSILPLPSNPRRNFNL